MTSQVEQAEKACGICKSKENLVGPYCGGPFMWYCKNCKRVIDVFFEGQKRHHQFIEQLKKKRCKSPWGETSSGVQ